MQIKKYEPEVYRLHDFIKTRVIGEENAVSQLGCAYHIGILDRELYGKTLEAQLCDNVQFSKKELSAISTAQRKFRSLREQINDKDSPFMIKILSGPKGVYAASKDEAKEKYRKTAWRKIMTGVAHIKEGQSLLQSIGEDGQFRLKLSDHMKEIVEIGVEA